MIKRSHFQLVRFASTTAESDAGSSMWWKFAGLAAGALLTAGAVEASDDTLQPPQINWGHSGFMSSFDTASLRRGYEVYRQVCSTCHSLKFIKFRHLVGVTHTEEQAKALAASYTVQDGPNSQGEMFDRPGKLLDGHPNPYANEEMARYANGGAVPPDLSLMIKARARREDYVFHLLTGFTEPPANVELREGLHYNPYFPGGAISMAKPLSDGMLDNEDGTPASVAQMAKDVTEFLTWAAEPEHDERKRTGIKVVTALTLMAVATGILKKRAWSVIKSRKIWYRPIPAPYKVYDLPKKK